MAEPFIGEVKIVSFGYPPRGWALANGQLLPVNQNAALFSLFGTTYGGDGRVNFALPNLQGRVPIHAGAGFVQGQAGGETAHTLTSNEMARHTHQVVADDTLAPADGNLPAPTKRLAGSSGGNLYGPVNDVQPMSPASVSTVGGGLAHDNMSPYLTLCMIVALVGIYPSRN